MNRLPLIIGHRGASAHAPENTLAALQMAIDQGADGVEFDVRLAKDGIPVVIHDIDLRRVAGLKASVASFTSAELASVDIGTWFNSAFPRRASAAYSKETVPSLARVLDILAASDGVIYIEVKTDGVNPDRFVRNVCEIIGGSPMLPRMIVKSFSLDALERVRHELPQVETAALFEPAVNTVFRRRADLVAMAAECGARHISLHWSLVSRRLVENARKAHMDVTVWTVAHPRWFGKARQMGIRSLITNDPARLIAVRDSLAEMA